MDQAALRFNNGTLVVIGAAWSVVTLPSGREVHAHPQHSAEQAETAQHLGYGTDVDAMTRDHDLLHVSLTDWLGLPQSFSLAEAAGCENTDHHLADLEERAVLAVQRLMVAAGLCVPTDESRSHLTPPNSQPVDLRGSSPAVDRIRAAEARSLPS